MQCRVLPWVVDYQLILSEEIGISQKRIHQLKLVQLRLYQTIYAPADDLTDPYKATTFVYFDKTILFNP